MTNNLRARAVVLAAGQGKRMKSDRPKVLHDVLGKTILTRVLDALDALSLEHIHIVLGHGASDVQDFLADRPPVTSWSTHLQEPQLGTGHALMQVVPALAEFEGSLLVTVGDTPLVTGATLEKLLQEHQRAQATVSLLTTRVEDAKNYGRIVRDAQGNVTGIVEDKDASAEQRLIDEINPAIYCFNWPSVKPGLQGLKNENRQQEYYLTDLIGWASSEKLPVASLECADWREVAGINSRLELSEACGLLRDRVITSLSLDSGVSILDPFTTWISPEAQIGQDTVVLPGCCIFGDVTIGQRCTIGPHTYLKGPVSIGSDTSVAQSVLSNSQVGNFCKVGPFAHLRDGAVAADKVRLGNYVEVKKSKIAERTSVSHLSYVGDATLGSGVNIGAGTITANYDHITKVKSTTVIGDGASTGSNSVLVAPVVIGPGAVIAAGTVVTRDVPAGALAVGRARQETKEGWSERKKRQSVSP
jgi:bifunctional UDP-N-acetylglucosamine pyrophosphorylase / glucosamine-1-phosphate N-acetyltransferase